MTYIIEGNNHLFTPDYWGGIDIATYQGPMPKVSGSVLGDVAEEARDLLWEAGEDILEGHYWEESVPFEKMPDEYGDGTIVIMDSETLRPLNGPPPEEWNAKEHTECSPIVTPYAEYWRTNQNAQNMRRPEFGSELAVDAVSGRSYHRSLEWGVLLTTAEGERKIGTWPIDHLWMSREGMALRPVVQAMYTLSGQVDTNGLVITREPFSVNGKAHVYGTYGTPEFNGNVRKRTTALQMVVMGISRVRDVRIISTPHGTLLPLPETFDFGDMPTLVNAQSCRT